MKRGKLASFWLFRLLAVFSLSAVAGCMGLENRISPKTVLANPAAERPVSSLAISEITGMPDKSAARLRAHLKAELASRGIALVNSPQKAAYSLKAFTSAASGAQGVTLVNIWEVLDKNGRRAHRFIGEETGPASPGDDPWDGVNSTMLNAVAVNLARDYKAWASGKTIPARTPANAAPSRPPHRKAPVRIAASKPLVTGSIAAGAARRTVSVTPLSGAPGDGNRALAKALKAALQKSGYKVLPIDRGAAYIISGRVYISPPRDGKQDLAIDWKVVDVNWRRVGVIKQRNRVKALALERQWGATASGAAKAAARHIVRLLR